MTKFIERKATKMLASSQIEQEITEAKRAPRKNRK